MVVPLNVVAYYRHLLSRVLYCLQNGWFATYTQQARTIAVTRLSERKVLLIGYVQVHIGKLILAVRETTQRFKTACCFVMRTRLWIPGPM